MDDTVSACKDLQQAVKIKKKIHIQRGKDGVKLPRWPFFFAIPRQFQWGGNSTVSRMCCRAWEFDRGCCSLCADWVLSSERSL